MTDYVVIRSADAGGVAEAIVVDGDGTQKSEVLRGPLAAIAAEVDGRPVIALVPGADVVTTAVGIPARSAARIRAALPFALEEMLADDVENLHFAMGRRDDDNRIPVAIAAHSAIVDWQTPFVEAGIEPTRMLAENQGLAPVPGTISLLVDGDTFMLNDGAGREFVLQGEKPSDILIAADLLGSDGDASRASTHLVAYCSEADQARYQHDWNALRHELDSVDIRLLPDGSLPLLAAGVATGHGIDLLQGRYARAPEYRAALAPWKTAASLAGVMLILALLALGVGFISAARDNAALKEQFLAEYRTLRPGDTRDITDPINTVRSLQRGQGSAAAPPIFLESLAALAGAVAGGSDTSIEGISYRAGVIDVSLITQDVESLGSIEQAVSRSGRFDATVLSAQQVGELTNGKLQIRESAL